MMRENRNIVERTGATSELSSRWNLVGMLSGIDALLGLKGHCIEFKYYADGIHTGLTPPG